MGDSPHLGPHNVLVLPRDASVQQTEETAQTSEETAQETGPAGPGTRRAALAPTPAPESTQAPSQGAQVLEETSASATTSSAAPVAAESTEVEHDEHELGGQRLSESLQPCTSAAPTTLSPAAPGAESTPVAAQPTWVERAGHESSWQLSESSQPRAGAATSPSTTAAPSDAESTPVVAESPEVEHTEQPESRPQPPLSGSGTGTGRVPRALPLGTTMIVQGLVQTIEVPRAARSGMSRSESGSGTGAGRTGTSSAGVAGGVAEQVPAGSAETGAGAEPLATESTEPKADSNAPEALDTGVSTPGAGASTPDAPSTEVSVQETEVSTTKTEKPAAPASAPIPTVPTPTAPTLTSVPEVPTASTSSTPASPTQTAIPSAPSAPRPTTTPSATPPSTSASTPPSSTDVLGLLLSIAAQATAEALVPWSVPPRSRNLTQSPPTAGGGEGRERIANGLAAAFSALASGGANAGMGTGLGGGGGMGMGVSGGMGGVGMGGNERELGRVDEDADADADRSPTSSPSPTSTPSSGSTSGTPPPTIANGSASTTATAGTTPVSTTGVTPALTPAATPTLAASATPSASASPSPTRRLSPGSSSPSRRLSFPRRFSSLSPTGSMRSRPTSSILEEVELAAGTAGSTSPPSSPSLARRRASSMFGRLFPWRRERARSQAPEIVQTLSENVLSTPHTVSPVSPPPPPSTAPPPLPPPPPAPFTLPNPLPHPRLPSPTPPTTDAEDLVRFSHMLGFTPGVVHPSGSFERFLADMQDELRSALGEFQERTRGRGSVERRRSSGRRASSAGMERRSSVGGGESSGGAEEGQGDGGERPVRLDHTRPHVPSTDPLPLNWWRMFRFPALPESSVGVGGVGSEGVGATTASSGSATASSGAPSLSATTPSVGATTPASGATTPDPEGPQPIHPAIIIGLRSVSRDPLDEIGAAMAARGEPRRASDGMASGAGADGDVLDRVRNDARVRALASGGARSSTSNEIGGTPLGAEPRRSSMSDAPRRPASLDESRTGSVGRARGDSWTRRIGLRRETGREDGEETARESDSATPAVDGAATGAGETRRSRDGTRNYVIWIIGGYYPSNHPLLAHPNLFLGQVHPDELWMLNEFLGQVKPPTASREDIAKAGLRVIKGKDISEFSKDGGVTENCTERCLICLDDYADEEDLRIMGCRHMFHKDCVDRWVPFNLCLELLLKFTIRL
ncbi:hypothetical protein BDV93DRAFT_325293 [Ceratobasidium sp. AG-I]|nr:hypothetical protein BDV93DRAFT_325293 [Ceratobasidium sp. AG-I]